MTAQAGDTTASKPALRTVLRRTRMALPRAHQRAAARRAAAHALRLIARLRARHVALYQRLGSELDTRPLLNAVRARRLRVYLPRLRGTRLEFAPRRSLRTLDLILLPLLGYDARGTRLGQGGGHYDRALAFPRAFRRPLLIGYAYSAQKSATLPREAHDVRLDAVITEQGLEWLTG